MTGMIEWFNINHGVLIAILTAVYVLTTIGILLSAGHSNKLMKEAMMRASRPFVIVDLYPEKEFFYLRFKNAGVIPAIDVSVRFDKQVKIYNNKELMQQYKGVQNLPIVGPAVEILFFLDKRTSFIERNKHLQAITGRLSYRSPLSDVYEEPITIDISLYTEMIKIS